MMLYSICIPSNSMESLAFAKNDIAVEQLISIVKELNNGFTNVIQLWFQWTNAKVGENKVSIYFAIDDPDLDYQCSYDPTYHSRKNWQFLRHVTLTLLEIFLLCPKFNVKKKPSKLFIKLNFCGKNRDFVKISTFKKTKNKKNFLDNF